MTKNQRLKQLPRSNDEEDKPHPLKPVGCSSKNHVESEDGSKSKRRKPVKLVDEDEDEDGDGCEPKADQEGGQEEKSARNVKEEEEEEEEEAGEDAKPVGKPVKFSGEVMARKSHYIACIYKGDQYKLEDTVLLNPAETGHKPYVAIIKVTIHFCTMPLWAQKSHSELRDKPEEAKIKGGGESWQSLDIRELFYSFHQNDVPLESVMHKCVIHYIPVHKQIPDRKQSPGFIVQKIYDPVEEKLWELIDEDYGVNIQKEINLLLQKTLQRLGDLPDLEIEDDHADQVDQLKRKR
ncbi:uncharacterized protein LOC125315275 [Rhodamnia argentea]|uniref:Uncharacterized protein LOC125315275 n=1 Tax=Rhodamnia argentea TaxID=178133 RepID=A0ABM3HGG7_9MYRT|nr:uncharacterized protein LOC125315275 [Rhodamnia argentea]